MFTTQAQEHWIRMEIVSYHANFSRDQCNAIDGRYNIKTVIILARFFNVLTRILT